MREEIVWDHPFWKVLTVVYKDVKLEIQKVLGKTGSLTLSYLHGKNFYKRLGDGEVLLTSLIKESKRSLVTSNQLFFLKQRFFEFINLQNNGSTTHSLMVRNSVLLPQHRCAAWYRHKIRLRPKSAYSKHVAHRKSHRGQSQK